MRLRNCDLPVLFLLAYSLQSVICTDQEEPTQAEGNINEENNGANVTETLIQLLNQTEVFCIPRNVYSLIGRFYPFQDDC